MRCVTMKKVLLTLCLMLVMGITIACSNDEPDNGDQGDRIIDPVCGVDRTDIDPDDIIHISYASFDDQRIEQEMVCEFQRQNPHIQVRFRSDVVEMSGVVDLFTNSIVQLAAIGDTIDVFQVMAIDPLVQNVLVYDIAELWNNDPDTAYVLPDAAAAAVYGDRRLGMANGQVLQGIFVNKDLLNDNNFDLENYGFDFSTGEIWNYEEMIQLARDFTTRARSRYNNDFYWGIDGDWNNLNFAWTLPAMDNPEYGMNSFDGTRFNFTDPLYISHYQREIDLYLEGVKNDIRRNSAAAQLEFGTTAPDAFFTEGRVLLYSSYTWNFFEFPNVSFDMMFLPFPKGVAEDAVQRTPSSIGIMALSKTTNHPQEAYELAKFMTWGREGNLAKLDIHEDLNERLTKFPVSDFPDVWSRIEATYIDSDSPLYVEGFDMIMYTMLENRQTVMDFGKWLPGYNEFKNWYQNVQSESRRNDVRDGLIQFADVAAVWENKVNTLVTEKLEMYAKYPDFND